MRSQRSVGRLSIRVIHSSPFRASEGSQCPLVPVFMMNRATNDSVRFSIVQRELRQCEFLREVDPSMFGENGVWYLGIGSFGLDLAMRATDPTEMMVLTGVAVTRLAITLTLKINMGLASLSFLTSQCGSFKPLDPPQKVLLLLFERASSTCYQPESMPFRPAELIST
ncbi:hypothetical protein Acr_00g0047000 [Actinidia rufa]|uniref:Uncharacterized protein n=1 Tax=Actinidia rufa TaxID=165716 RepID=A0A7J0DJQ6_9ERIC|nr:hypothetical protein Acr_00g0047000 [Actinidia rufa]